MALNPNEFVDGVMNGFSLHIEPPSYHSHLETNIEVQKLAFYSLYTVKPVLSGH